MLVFIAAPAGFAVWGSRRGQALRGQLPGFDWLRDTGLRALLEQATGIHGWERW
jgi:hypothetical protein